MDPIEDAAVIELGRRIVTSDIPERDHWSCRIIQPGERHLLVRESLCGRVTETRHSSLSAYLHVACLDGLAAEFLADDEPVAPAG